MKLKNKKSLIHDIIKNLIHTNIYKKEYDYLIIDFIMRDDTEFKKSDYSKMFSDDASFLTTDEDIALHVIHRFNIDKDTMETMPAIDASLGSLFWPKKNK